MATKNLTLVRLKEILRRQDPPRWGREYQPAIRATREEAPSRSRYSVVWSEKFDRYCHTLSMAEQEVLILALFHPAVFELHEQRMLAVEPRPHPMSSHPRCVGIELPPLRGTVDVCDRLDMIQHHNWIHVNHPDGSGKLPVPFPFIGDFLLFLVDEAGPYCVNWTIKATLDDFNHPLEMEKPSRNPKAAGLAERCRHAIEERYYRDAGIPTIRIAGRDLPRLLIQNLRSLLLLQHRARHLDKGIYEEICERLQASIQIGQAPLDVLLSVMQRHSSLSLDDAKAAFHRALWRRDVQAEMMDESIFIDRPLKPLRRDPLQVFSTWFSREANK